MVLGADTDGPRPPAPTLIDRYGRVATDSAGVADRPLQPAVRVLHAPGRAAVAPGAVRAHRRGGRAAGGCGGTSGSGVTEVRFTGGEPLLRPGLAAIVAAVAALRPRPRIALTTNGIGLDRLAGPLREAGLDRVNVSLDTLDPDRFAALAHRRRLPDVLAGIAAAAAAGLRPVKLNAVLVRGINDDEAAALLRFALDHGYELRFIEQMPLDPHQGWDRSQMVTAVEILDMLRAVFPLRPDPDPPRVGAGRDLAGRRVHHAGRVTGQGGRHRQRHPAVLRRLRPDQVDRRRAGARLPVRQGRDGPAHPTAGRRLRRRVGRPVAGRDVDEAPRARHRRPGVPATCPPDVRDRRMTVADMITVRFFAGARAAAGVPETTVPAGCTLDELITTLAARHGARLATVLGAASFLVDGAACLTAPGRCPPTTVDVLPPFAGG